MGTRLALFSAELPGDCEPAGGLRRAERQGRGTGSWNLHLRTNFLFPQEGLLRMEGLTGGVSRGRGTGHLRRPWTSKVV